MRAKAIATILLALVLSAFGWVLGQRSTTPQSAAASPGMMHQHMEQGMMSHEQMEAMMDGHREAVALLDQVTRNFTDLQKEESLALVRQKLGENLELLQELRAEISQEGEMMRKMQTQMENCPMMQSEHNHDAHSNR